MSESSRSPVGHGRADTGSMQPSPEAVAWAQRADAWAQQPESPVSSPAGRAAGPMWPRPAGPLCPADGVGWRTETAEWRATAQSARWRQTTEWRSATGTPRLALDHRGLADRRRRATSRRRPTRRPGSRPSPARPGPPLPTTTSPARAGSRPTPSGSSPWSRARGPPRQHPAVAWQRRREHTALAAGSHAVLAAVRRAARALGAAVRRQPAPWQPPNRTPALVADAHREPAEPAPGSRTSSSRPPRAGRPETPSWRPERPTWQSLAADRRASSLRRTPAPRRTPAAVPVGSTTAATWSARTTAPPGAATRPPAGGPGDGTRQIGRRRAPEVGEARAGGGTGWTTRSEPTTGPGTPTPAACRCTTTRPPTAPSGAGAARRRTARLAGGRTAGAESPTPAAGAATKAGGVRRRLRHQVGRRVPAARLGRPGSRRAGDAQSALGRRGRSPPAARRAGDAELAARDQPTPSRRPDDDWRQDERAAPDWRRDDRETPDWREDDRERKDWREDDRERRDWRREPPSGPWAQAAADTGVISAPWQQPTTDTGSWRTETGPGERTRPSNPNRRRDDGIRPTGRRRDEMDGAALVPLDPEIWRREPGSRTDGANWPVEDEPDGNWPVEDEPDGNWPVEEHAPLDWRQQLRDEQRPVGEAATEIRQRIEPGAWQREEARRPPGARRATAGAAPATGGSNWPCRTVTGWPTARHAASVRRTSSRSVRPVVPPCRRARRHRPRM